MVSISSIWKEQVEISKIPRINYKGILGMSLTNFILENREKEDGDILEMVLKEIKKHKDLVAGWDFRDIRKNILIGISARRTEQKIYKTNKRG